MSKKFLQGFDSIFHTSQVCHPGYTEFFIQRKSRGEGANGLQLSSMRPFQPCKPFKNPGSRFGGLTEMGPAFPAHLGSCQITQNVLPFLLFIHQTTISASQALLEQVGFKTIAPTSRKQKNFRNHHSAMFAVLVEFIIKLDIAGCQ